MSKDYYKILGVNKSASADEIKKAFRKLAHEHHPDKTNGNADKFKEINEAYQVLGDSQKRSQYDQFGSAYQNQAGSGAYGNPFAQGFSGFQGAQGMDFDLGDIFGSFFGGQAGGRSTQSQRGADLEVNLKISLKDAVFGVSRNITLNKKIKCNTCHGNGAKNGEAFTTCNTCHGSGHVTATILGQFRTQTICPECRGQGKIIKEKCSQCSGQGILHKQEDIKVEIPGGIDTGQSIRLSGQGDAGASGAHAGDLYINIIVQNENGFVRQDFDLLTTNQISFATAALGGEVDVKTIDGKVKLKIPSGTQSGKQFILRGKGVTKLKSRGRGDQIVKIEIAVPNKLNSKQKALIEQLDKELGDKKSWWA